MFLLSIIVPVYNVEKYLRCAIDSLICASDDRIEIVLVDDGSTDNSGKICDEYKNKRNIVIIHKENGGLPSARKAGLIGSTGDYIGFLDGDDWVDSDYYTNMLNVAMEKNVDMVVSSFQYDYATKVSNPPQQLADGLYAGKSLMKLREHAIYRTPYYSFGIFPSLCMKIIRRSYMEKYLLEAPNYLTIAEDAVCSFPIIYACEAIYIMGSNIGYHYRQHSNSMSYHPDARKVEKIINALTYFDTVFGPYSEYNHQKNMFFSTLIRDGIKNETLLNESFEEYMTKMSYLRDNVTVENALHDASEIPGIYGIQIELFKKRKFRLLLVLYKLLGSIKA